MFDFILLIAIRAVRIATSVIPVRVLIPVSGKIGSLLPRFFPKETNIIIAQFRAVCASENVSSTSSTNDSAKACRLTQIDPRDLPSLVFRHAAVVLAETLRLSKILGHKDLFELIESPMIQYDGVADLKELLSLETGSLVLSGHVGPWELLGALHARQPRGLSVIGRTPNYPVLLTLLEEIRRAYGVETIWRRSSTTAAHIMKALKTGRSVALLIDQDANLKNSFYPLFGIPAPYPISALQMAVKKRFPVAVAFVIRLDQLSYKVNLRRIRYEELESDEVAIAFIMDQYTSLFEDIVRQHPDQWIWWHRRWRRRPGVSYEDHPEALPSTLNYLRWLDELASKRHVAK